MPFWRPSAVIQQQNPASSQMRWRALDMTAPSRGCTGRQMSSSAGRSEESWGMLLREEAKRAEAEGDPAKRDEGGEGLSGGGMKRCAQRSEPKIRNPGPKRSTRQGRKESG